MKIHIFGASGSGTSTLGNALANTLNIRHFDTDDFYWKETDPPFQTKVPLEVRSKSLLFALTESSWALSGSLSGWGDFTIPYFDLVIFVYLDPKIRMQRLHLREEKRYGSEIKKPDHPQYKIQRDFLAWAQKYDTAGLEMRSLARHQTWLKDIHCPVLRLDKPLSVKAHLEQIKVFISEI